MKLSTKKWCQFARCLALVIVASPFVIIGWVWQFIYVSIQDGMEMADRGLTWWVEA